MSKYAYTVTVENVPSFITQETLADAIKMAIETAITNGSESTVKVESV